MSSLPCALTDAKQHLLAGASPTCAAWKGDLPAVLQTRVSGVSARSPPGRAAEKEPNPDSRDSLPSLIPWKRSEWGSLPVREPLGFARLKLTPLPHRKALAF